LAWSSRQANLFALDGNDEHATIVSSFPPRHPVVVVVLDDGIVVAAAAGNLMDNVEHTTEQDEQERRQRMWRVSIIRLQIVVLVVAKSRLCLVVPLILGE
jgi:hypothetical protein